MNTIRNLIIFYGLISLYPSYSQIGDISDQFVLGGTHSDVVLDAFPLDNGGMIILANSYSLPSGNKTSPHYGVQDLWLIELDQNMNIVWQYTYGGSAADVEGQLLILADGGYLLTCSSNSSISGNKTVGTFGDYDIWAIKVSSTGSILWQKNFGGNLQETSVCTVELPDHSLIFGATSKSDISGNKSEETHGPSDFWIFRTDSNGELIWDRTIGGNSTEVLRDFCLSDTTITLCGFSNSDSSYDKTQDSYGSSDFWLLQIGFSDTILWDRTYGGSDGEDPSSIKYNGHGFYIVGNSWSGISGTKTEINRGLNDNWILKLDNNGYELWQSCLGGNLEDAPYGITFTNKNQILFWGVSFSDDSYDKSEPCRGSSDIWILSIDTNGTFLWDKTIGSDGTENIRGLFINSDYDIMICGSSDSDIGFDKIVPQIGTVYADIWLIRAKSFLSHPEENSLILNLFPNPASEYFMINAEIYMVQIFSSQGAKLIEYSNYDGSAINTIELNPGMYFVAFELGGISHFHKLIIQ